jgi:hypothetical protein
VGVKNRFESRKTDSSQEKQIRVKKDMAEREGFTSQNITPCDLARYGLRPSRIPPEIPLIPKSRPSGAREVEPWISHSLHSSLSSRLSSIGFRVPCWLRSGAALLIPNCGPCLKNEMRKLKLPKFDLTTKCTECGYAIPLAEILRTGWHLIRCPKCGKDFTV